MKPLGWVIAVCGLIYMFIAFNMDVSISTSSVYVPGYGSVGGGDVANLDLMARRQNHIIVASTITIIGSLMGIFGRPLDPSSQPTSAAEVPKRLAFEGERDLSHDAYRLWLADEYQIKRNEVFDRFVMGDATFDTLDAALSRANELENEKRAEAEAAEREQQQRLEEYRIYVENAREEAESEWQRNKPKLIAGGIIFAIVVAVGIYFLIDKADEERAKALALKESEIVELKEQHGFDLSSQDVSRISEIGQYDTFRCDDRTYGTLVTFGPKTEADEILPLLDAALGEHETEYEFEGSGEWVWSKDEIHFVLDSISSELTLCIADKP